MSPPTTETSIRVSFIVTLYNKEPFVARTLASALDAAGPDTEILIVEDGSTDGSYAAAAAIAAKEPRIRLLRNPGKGTVDGTNFAVEAARSEYIFNLDADDLCLPWRVDLARAVLDAFPQVGLVSGIRRRATPDRVEAVRAECLAEHAARAGLRARRLTAGSYFRDNPLSHSQACYRRAMWRAAGGYRGDFITCLDYDFYVRTLPHGEHWQLDLPLAIDVIDPDSIYRTTVKASYRSDYRACQHLALDLGGITPMDRLIGELRYRYRFGLTGR